MIIDGWLSYLQVNRLASIYIGIIFCRIPFMQAAFVYTVQLAIGCMHKPFKFLMPHINVSVFLMCVYKFKVLPHHQKFSSCAPACYRTCALGQGPANLQKA